MDGNDDASIYVNSDEVEYYSKDYKSGNGYVGVTASSSLTIGNYSGGNDAYFNGRISRFKMWNEHLDIDQASEEFGNEIDNMSLNF